MRPVLLALVMVLPAASALAQAPPRIATTLDPADGAVVVGQPVQMHVRVLFADDMAHPPLVSVPEAPGAQIMRFESQALTVRDQIDGQAYVGKDFAFTVYPRRAGDIAIPAPRVTLLDRGGDPAGEARGTPTHIHARVPPGLDASGPVLVSSRVAARQEWSPDGGAKPVAPPSSGSFIARRMGRRHWPWLTFVSSRPTGCGFMLIRRSATTRSTGATSRANARTRSLMFSRNLDGMPCQPSSSCGGTRARARREA